MYNRRTIGKSISALVAIIIAMVITSACSKAYKEIKIKDVKIVDFEAASFNTIKASLLVLIDNPSKSEIEIENLTSNVYRKNSLIATLRSENVVEVPAKQLSEQPLSVMVEIENALSMIFSVLEDKNVDLDEFTVDIAADIKSGIAQIPWSKNNVPLKDIVNQVDRMKKSGASTTTANTENK